MSYKLYITLFFFIFYGCSDRHEQRSVNTNIAIIDTLLKSPYKMSQGNLEPKDSIQLRYEFNKEVPKQFKFNDSIIYLGNGQSIVGFDLKGEKVLEIKIAEEILNGIPFSDFEVSEVFNNMYYLLIGRKFILVDANDSLQKIVFEYNAGGDKIFSAGKDNFFIPYQSQSSDGGIINSLKKYFDNENKLNDFKSNVDFSGESFLASNGVIYFISEGNELHLVSYNERIEPDIIQLEGMIDNRAWVLGFLNDKLLVKQVSDSGKDIIYELNKNNFKVEKSNLLDIDYSDINQELLEDEDLFLDNPNRIFYASYKNSIKVLRIGKSGNATVYSI